MSGYTDLEHEEIKKDTIYFERINIESSQKEYEYGRFQERLKDYEKAKIYYEKAIKKGVIKAAYLYLKGSYNKFWEIENEEKLSKQIFEYYKNKSHSAKDYYRLGDLYKHGIGTLKDEKMALKYFQISAEQKYPKALYEIGIFYLEGIGGCEKEIIKARKYLRAAYDEHCEEAIFKDFEIFGDDFKNYEYKREIIEAYSFKLGQLIRVAELYRTRKTYQYVIEMYENGFPGDTGEKRKAFIRKADKYKKLLMKLKE